MCICTQELYKYTSIEARQSSGALVQRHFSNGDSATALLKAQMHYPLVYLLQGPTL